MSRDEREDDAICKVIVSRGDRYSIWPADRENALGWTDAGKKGTRKQCLAYIEKVSKDARPPAEKKK
ncbi:MAG TPA: MbtH family protein [Pyrinomonadaceae bacterium]|nr:MbtH family protein [Pyrinomonadaceae bacterium]